MLGDRRLWPFVMQVADHFIVAVVNLEAMSDVGGGQCVGDTFRVTVHRFKGVAVSINDGIANVAAIRLKDKVIAVAKANGILADVNVEACRAHDPRHFGFRWPTVDASAEKDAVIHLIHGRSPNMVIYDSLSDKLSRVFVLAEC